MVKYVPGPNGIPVKMNPVVAEEEWAFLVQRCADLEPTNMTRSKVKRDGTWIKEHWSEMRKILSALFQKYNSSGLQADKFDWSNLEELRRWENCTNSKVSTTVRFPTACLYSLCLFEKNDFYAVNRQMEEGT